MGKRVAWHDDYYLKKKKDGSWEFCNSFKKASSFGCEDYVYDEIDEDKECDFSEIVVPAYYNDEPITSILCYFRTNYKIKKLCIPSTVSNLNVYDLTWFNHNVEIDIDPDSPYFKKEDGIIFSRDGKELVLFNKNYEGHYVVPDGVEKISDGAFAYCKKLRSVEFSGTVKYIGRHSLAHCNELCFVVIPEGVEEIEDCVFEYCDKITHLEMPFSLKKAYYQTFEDCKNLRVVSIGEDTKLCDHPKYCVFDEGYLCIYGSPKVRFKRLWRK